jgi:hypothetical protein
VADDRKSAETPAPAQDRANGRPIAVPAQPTWTTPAPSTSQHDRESAASKPGKPRTRRLSHVYSTGKTVTEAVRIRVAAAIWMAAVLAAVALSLGALLVAFGANTDNSLVSAVLDLDHAIDGPFWKVFDFYDETKSGARGAPDDVKNHLVNWGLAAASYLVVGRFLDRVIRPATR